MSDVIKFKGKVKKCIYNSETFKVYAVDVDKSKYPEVKLNKYSNATVSGDIHDLMIDVEYEFTGEEQSNKYGVGYKVINLKRDVPTTKETTFAFLSEILTENQARVLVDNYPSIIQMVKDNNTKDVDLNRLKGIGEKSFKKIQEKIIENFCLIDLVAEFKGVLSMTMIKKIYDKYPDIEQLKLRLKKEPYTTLTRLSGIGFIKADSIVMKLQEDSIIDFGYEVKTSKDRCLACVLYQLEENENQGNTKDNLVDLRSKVLKLTPECADHYATVITNPAIYYNKETMDIALSRTYEAEKYIAEIILSNLHNTDNIWLFNTEKYKNIGEFELSNEQMQVLDMVCKNNIVILNGFGGSGKTYSTKSLIKMLRDNNKTFYLLSPTGRAAKVLHENTGEVTHTIHRGLGYVPPDKWAYNQECKLWHDIVIVDEFSMVDIWLFKKLLEAIDFKHTKLLLIGDNAQIPSISSGNLLHDFMESNLIPTITLNKIFRYSEGGLMRVATDARCCTPYLTNDMKSKATIFGDNQDYMFVDLPSESIPKNVIALYKKLLDSGNSISDIQVLTAKNVGDCGSEALNNMIQKIANPNYGSSINMKIGETTYYKGDLVLQVVNNYKAEVMKDNSNNDFFEDEPQETLIANGETGTIIEIGDSYVVIKFEDAQVKYNKNDMNMVKLGYAISIFKAQGGGFNIVILCTPQSHAFMLNSNLLYVGLTRMKKKLYHLGTLRTVNQTVKKKANLVRNTFMQELLKENL